MFFLRLSSKSSTEFEEFVALITLFSYARKLSRGDINELDIVDFGVTMGEISVCNP